MKTDTQQPAKVDCYWDDQAGVEPGWYCMTLDDDGRLIDDSQKVWFPVAVDCYDHDQSDDLREALAEEFPGAEISVRD